MPPRRRKKPPDPTPLSLPFTSLFKKNPSVLECQLLGHISQFIDLGKIVGLASNSASISGRFSRPLSPTVQQFGIPKRFHSSSYVLCCHLCSSCLDSSGFNLPCSGLGCSSLGNYSSFQGRFLSLDRSNSVLLVVGGEFACYGYGRTLSPSSVPVIWTRGPGSATVKSNTPGRLAGLRSDGCLVALLLHLQRGSYCVTVQNRPEWPLPTVSTHFRLLIFRSGFQVCFLPLYPSPLRVICCHSFYLMDRSLQYTMNQIGSRFISSNVFLYFCWMLIKQLYYLDKICQVLGHLCDVLPVDIRMAILLALNPINMCFALKSDKDVFVSCRGFWKGFFGCYNRCLNAYSPCFGIVFRSVHLDMFERVRSFGPLWQFILLVLTCSCILRSLVAGLIRDHVYHLPDSRLGSRGPVCCKDQQGSLLKLHLSLTDEFPYKTKTTSYLMRLFNVLSEARVEILLNWVPPSLLLSLGSLAVFYLFGFKPSLLSLLLNSLVLPLILLCSYGVKPLESGLQFSQWADHVYLGLILDVCTSTPFVQLALRTSCVTYKAQHGSKCDMCRRYIGLAGHSFEGGWFLLPTMILNSSLPTMWVKLSLAWGLPSLWLFRFMVSPYAQILGNLCSSICWHLAFLLNDWDEVSEQAIVLMLHGQTDQVRLMAECLKPVVA